MRALITGATGFVGTRLIGRITEPVVLSRNPQQAARTLAAHQPASSRSVEVHGWDSQREPPPAEAFRGVEAVIHLAGESVAEGRWSAAKKARIMDSRVLGTRNLVAALAGLGERPPVLVSASAVGFYGSRGDEVLAESSTRGHDFLADVCVAWEAEAAAAGTLGIRVVTPRIGLVLGIGGPLARMLPPFKLGVGGPLGRGKQWMSWIHLDDMVGLLLHAAEREQIAGAMNTVGPTPATNREFTKALGKALHRPTIFPVPYFAMRAALGEFAKVLFDSQRVEPRVAVETGYEFQYPTVDSALTAILA